MNSHKDMKLCSLWLTQEEVKRIEIWGKPSNCKVLQGIMNSDNINNI